MKIICLRNSKERVLIDDCDFEWLNKYKWYRGVGRRGYAFRYVSVRENKVSRLMHRQIMGVTDSKIQVDHINHNRLDNRRCNLRVCNNLQNHQNTTIHRDNRSGYKGVSFCRTGKRAKRWVAAIQVDKKKIFLGYFMTREEASLAYNQRAKKDFGEFACLSGVGHDRER